MISGDVVQLFGDISARTLAVGNNFLPSRHVYRLLCVRAVLICFGVHYVNANVAWKLEVILPILVLSLFLESRK